MPKTLLPCVIAFKAARDKGGQNTLIYQVAQVTTYCVHENYKIVDSVCTHGGLREIKREALNILAKKEFKVLILYSPMQIAETVDEFKTFIAEMDEHGVIVLWLRNM